ncbi:putative nuclease HARBI1 [Heptranchias perlo]|uniref:putative nuclease HARBI1 n=1 Tax=Heptranchias perlo TaxID=212740 RepID=UPI003559F763
MGGLWNRRLRFTKEVLFEICQLLQPQLQLQSRASLPVAVKVTVALNFYASGSFQAAAGDISNISQFVAHCSIREVTEALYTMKNTFISFPLARDKQEEQARGFARIASFPMVQGAIDFTHIALRASHLNSAIFINRKVFHSLKVKLVCDHRLRIMQISACYPGSSHDSFILWQSSVPPVFQPARQFKGWLLDHMLSPHDMDHDSGQEPTRMCTAGLQQVPSCHKEYHNITEHTIGGLKQRSCCLDRSGGALQ